MHEKADMCYPPIYVKHIVSIFQPEICVKIKHIEPGVEIHYAYKKTCKIRLTILEQLIIWLAYPTNKRLE